MAGADHRGQLQAVEWGHDRLRQRVHAADAVRST
jgi:hypothetical protein